MVRRNSSYAGISAAYLAPCGTILSFFFSGLISTCLSTAPSAVVPALIWPIRLVLAFIFVPIVVVPSFWLASVIIECLSLLLELRRRRKEIDDMFLGIDRRAERVRLNWSAPAHGLLLWWYFASVYALPFLIHWHYGSVEVCYVSHCLCCNLCCYVM